MRADDRIVTESAYYNCPSLVGSKTKYKYYMVKYYQTGNLEYKKVAQKELSEKSNRGNNRGLSMRRNHEVRISRVAQALRFMPPNQPLYSKDKIYRVSLGKDIIPYGMNKYFGSDENSKYFIWRSKLDHRVRTEHLTYHDKI